jgi:hypothetical protein
VSSSANLFFKNGCHHFKISRYTRNTEKLNFLNCTDFHGSDEIGFQSGRFGSHGRAVVVVVVVVVVEMTMSVSANAA